MNEPVKLTLEGKRLLLSILKDGEISETTGKQLTDYLQEIGVMQMTTIVFVDKFDSD